jgi:hypothetical protein
MQSLASWRFLFLKWVTLLALLAVPGKALTYERNLNWGRVFLAVYSINAAAESICIEFEKELKN